MALAVLARAIPQSLLKPVVQQAPRLQQQLRAYTCMDELPHMMLMAKGTECSTVGAWDGWSGLNFNLCHVCHYSRVRG